MARQHGPARRHGFVSAVLALSAFVGLLWPATGTADPAAVLATSFTVATDVLLTIRPDFSTERIIKARIKVLGEAAVGTVGQQSFVFHESQQSLEVVEAYTEKADGRRITVEAANIFTRDAATGAALILQRDLKSTTIIFPDVAVGDTLALTYRLSTRSDVLGRHVDDAFVFQRQAPLAPSTLKIVAPKSAGLKLAISGDGLRKESIETDDSVSYLISYDPKPRVLAEPGETSPFDRDPRVILSTFADYADLGRSWVAIAGTRTRVTPEIKALADEITRGIEDRRGQAEAIDRWVKRNIRYVALYLDAAAGWIPHEPNDIAKLRYGDCKDHATLMGALLAAKGIDSEAVVINAGTVYTLPEIAVRGYFNHMIIYLPEFGLYDDPTVATADFGVLGQGDYDKPVLRMSAAEVRLDRTPAMRPQDHISKNQTRIFIAADGSMSGETRESGSGVFGSGMRETRAGIEHNGPEKSAENQLKSNGWKGSGRFVLPASISLADPFTITGEFKLEAKLATAAGRETAIPSGLMTRVRAGNYLLGLRSEGRTNPFVCFAGKQIEEIDVTFADGLSLPVVPQGRKIDNATLSYVSQYRLDARTLKIRREFVSKVAGQVCAPQLEAQVADALKGVRADLDTKMRMPAAANPSVAANQPKTDARVASASMTRPETRPAATSSEAPNRSWCAGAENASADLRIHGCTAIIQSGQETPQSLAVAFTNRGHAYRMKGEYARALDDFNQAIGLVPNLAVAFNGRGLTWNAMRNYERAIADYSEAVRLLPTFATALVNRANAQRMAGEREQAMRDYNEAVRLDPTLVFAYLSRGRTYRVSGDADRANADFDEAIRLQRNNAFAWAESCYTRAIVDDVPKALEACNESLRLKPNDVYALANRGFVMLKLAEFDRAMTDFDAVLRLYPKDARALFGRGYAKTKKGDAEGGNRDMAAAKTIKPDVVQEFPKLDATLASTEGPQSPTRSLSGGVVSRN